MSQSRRLAKGSSVSSQGYLAVKSNLSGIANVIWADLIGVPSSIRTAKSVRYSVETVLLVRLFPGDSVEGRDHTLGGSR